MSRPALPLAAILLSIKYYCLRIEFLVYQSRPLLSFGYSCWLAIDRKNDISIVLIEYWWKVRRRAGVSIEYCLRLLLLIWRLFWMSLVLLYDIVAVAVLVVVADSNDRLVFVVDVTFCLEDKR